MELLPTPGLTVIHGANGSGKSSIASAIDVGLHQQVDASLDRNTNRGGQAPVWQPVIVNANHHAAAIQLTLRASDGTELTLKTRIDADDAATREAFIHHSAGPRSSVTLGTAWRSSLRAQPPTYAYGAWENFIQESRHLQEYLDRMLQLGGCYEAVRVAIEERASSAQEAAHIVKEALNTCEGAISELESTHGRMRPCPLPDPAEDLDAWWAASGLPKPSLQQVVSSGPVALDELQDAARALHDTLPALDEGAGDLSWDIQSALAGLDGAAHATASEACPVCGTATSWRSHLHEVVTQNASSRAREDAWKQSVQRLKNACDTPLPALVVASDPEHNQTLTQAKDAYEQLAALAFGARSLKETRSAATALSALLLSEPFAAEAALAAERASEEAAWLRAVAEAITPLVECLREHGPSAAELQAWQETKKALTTAGNDLRKARQANLQSMMDKAVQDLLRDAGIAVGVLNVQQRQARVTLTDLANNPLELGMLSAGQRNALLLAPALAVAQDSVFGTFVVDDPVHAFDELRVDFVAQHLARLAQRRRLVVFTHDERLREHLVAMVPDADAHSIQRDPRTGRVHITPAAPIWRDLLNDVDALMALAGKDVAQLKGLTMRLRGLCRQAVDNALRQFVTHEAVRQAAAPQVWMDQLESNGVYETKKRFATSISLASASTSAVSALEQARNDIDAFERLWNGACHGNPPPANATTFQRDELEAAQKACEGLAR